MNLSLFCNITSSKEYSLQRKRVSQASNQQEAGSKQSKMKAVGLSKMSGFFQITHGTKTHKNSS
jgi:hypothetical protein